MVNSHVDTPPEHTTRSARTLAQLPTNTTVNSYVDTPPEHTTRSAHTVAQLPNTQNVQRVHCSTLKTHTTQSACTLEAPATQSTCTIEAHTTKSACALTHLQHTTWSACTSPNLALTHSIPRSHHVHWIVTIHSHLSKTCLLIMATLKSQSVTFTRIRFQRHLQQYSDGSSNPQLPLFITCHYHQLYQCVIRGCVRQLRDSVAGLIFGERLKGNNILHNFYITQVPVSQNQQQAEVDLRPLTTLLKKLSLNGVLSKLLSCCIDCRTERTLKES